MLVWEGPGVMPNSFTGAGLTEGRDGLDAHESYLSFARRIIRWDRERFDIVPNKLAAALMDALRALAGCVVDAVATSCTRWQECAASANQAAAQHSRGASVKPLTGTPVRAVRRVKAFFISQKVNGRNAP